MPVEKGRGLHRGNFIAKVAVGHAIERLNIYHSRLRENFGAMLLRQVKVVLVERVLGAVAATHHAATAGHAGRPLRPIAAKTASAQSFEGFEFSGFIQFDSINSSLQFQKIKLSRRIGVEGVGETDRKSTRL